MSDQMAASERVSGRCLCGAVGFSAELKDGGMSACHCAQCRKWCAGPYMSLPAEPATVVIEGDALAFFRSSDRAERGFCSVCGSSLIWRTLDGAEADVSAQAVESSERFAFTAEFHVTDKPENYAFDGPTRKFAGGSRSPEMETGR